MVSTLVLPILLVAIVVSQANWTSPSTNCDNYSQLD
ncbi:hypothetical protein RIB2604_02110830 [Aspergillus luchuensis]|uniref:Uncharacterized protein n=1 Tax=Aspergillus kawachii TaxID=1069201 RepID=A0A146FQB5_ASPKA|nr:hypothetical protein RIB2604_02110830 [Aspergillus luchuensis]